MNLLNVTNVSQVWYSERNTENAMSDLYFHEESDYSEENTAWAWTEKTCGNESHKKGIKHIHASAVDLLHIRRANPDWCRCRHC